MRIGDRIKSESVIECIGICTKRLEGGLTEEEIVQSTSNPERTRKFRDSLYKFGKFVFFLVVINAIGGYLLFGSDYQTIRNRFYAAICGWLLLSSWLNNHPRILQLMCQYGYDTARQDFSKPKAKYVLFTNHGSRIQKEVNLLRMLDKGVLVAAQRNIVFYNWSNEEYYVAGSKYIAAKKCPHVNKTSV